MLIRDAAQRDVATVAALLGELGYPATEEEVSARLALLSSSPHATVVVADLDGRVVGLATGHVFQSIHATAPAAWLTTLVVSSDAYNRGVGRRLAEAIEDWARRAGAERISVTSGNHRGDAHAFYEHIGYRRTGIRLTKAL